MVEQLHSSDPGCMNLIPIYVTVDVLNMSSVSCTRLRDKWITYVRRWDVLFILAPSLRVLKRSGIGYGMISIVIINLNNLEIGYGMKTEVG